jgi:hypothetical protein
MKKAILFLLLVSSFFANAQSLKDALYSGKLKNEPGSVIRKGDDLASKIDTTHKAATDETAKAKATPAAGDSSTKALATQTDSATASTIDKKDGTAATADTATAGATANAPKENAPAAKDNNAVWKEYMNTIVSALKTEALSSKKLKRGTYYVLVSYAIDTDGQVAVSDVFVSPENAYLQQQVKDRLAVDTPHLQPVTNSSGTPRKVVKKYNFTLTKD